MARPSDLQKGLVGNLDDAVSTLKERGVGREVVMLLGERLADDVPDNEVIKRTMAEQGVQVQIVSSELPLSRVDCARVYVLKLVFLIEM